MIWICLENNLTDVEHERVRKAQEEDLRKRMLVEARLESRDRLKTRRIERQVVQFKANQAMQEVETEEIGEIS